MPSSIQDPSRTYTKFFPKWKKYRDIIQGEDSVKTFRELYLPRASGMNDDDYNSYLMRAQFFNASGRTLDGLFGMMFRKPVMYEVPKGMEVYLNNIDGKGHSLNQFVSSSAKDALTTGWGGVLVDMPKAENIVSQRDFEENNSYAYMTFYKAETIIKWRYQINGRQQSLKYVVFREEVEVDVADYTTETKFYYRICEIDEEGYYRQTLYNDNMQIIEQVYPSGKNGKFKFIPFYFLSVKDEPEESMFDDMVSVNLSHYRKSADYENGLHWTGVPTPWSQGCDVSTVVIGGKEVAEEPLKLGGSVVLNLPAGASLQYLEFSGSGCNQLANAMQADEERMAILGARIISAEKKGVEAAEAARIHRAGENSVLAEFAINLSIIFSKLLKIYLEWSTGTELNDDEVKVKINTDYDVSTMNSAQITALVALWQSGGIAKSDLFNNLKEGEILSADRKLDEMNAEIDEEQQAKMSMNPQIQNIENIEK